MLGPLLEKLIAERKGDIILAKVNIDEAQELASRHGVQAIPAVKAFRDGEVVLEFVGVYPEPALRSFLDQLCPSEADQLARQASMLEATNAVGAKGLYRHALDLDRNHEVSRVGLARILIAEGQDAEAAELLAAVEPVAEIGEEVERLKAILDLRQVARKFGDETSAQQRLNGEPTNPLRQFELGCVLAAAGKYKESLEMLRSAAEQDRQLARSQVRDVMVKIFHVIGVRSPLADEYRDKLARLLY